MQGNQMKERLVELIDNAQAEIIECYPDGKPCMSYTKKAVDRRVVYQLADYLLANGVIVPPCKVGDKVYHIHGKICEGEVESIHQNLVGKEAGRWIVTVWFDNYYANSREAGFE